MAFISRASSSAPPLEASLEWGSSGFKIHEDLGAYPAVIDQTLRVADEHDVQVMIHTDSINESVSLEDTIAAIAGRTIHAYHVEGAGGGHAPDLLEIVAEPNVLPSSTNPTNPFSAVGREGAPGHDHVRAPDEPRRSPRTSRSRSRASGPRRWRPRTCSTISARSR